MTQLGPALIGSQQRPLRSVAPHLVRDRCRTAARRVSTCARKTENDVRRRQEKAGQAALGLWTLAQTQQAIADGPAGAPQPPKGVSVGEIILLSAPIVLYGAFSLYREKINPRAKLSDFLFISAAVVIVSNVLSILIFKIRLY